MDVDDAGIVVGVPLSLAAGATCSVWTEATSTGGDPTLHLWAQQPDTSWAFVAGNDDHGVGGCASPPPGLDPRDACFVHTNPGTGSQNVTVMLHAFDHAYSGTTRLTVREPGQPPLYQQALPFAGDVVRSSGGEDVSWESDERLHFAYTITGMVFPRVLVLQNQDTAILQATKNLNGSIYGGLWGQPILSLPVDSQDPPPGTKGGPAYVVGNVFSSTGMGDGSARLYLNDTAVDTDGDDLGDELEQVLGTCYDPASQGPSCYTAQDTDGDGLWDPLETIGGAFHPDCASSDPGQGPTENDAGLGCAINLGTYGADPLALDVFVQVVWGSNAAGNDPWDDLDVDIDAVISTVVDRFEDSEDVFGVAKPVIHLHVDYGQWEHFGAGGRVLPYQERWCHNENNWNSCDDLASSYPSCTEPHGQPCTGCGASQCTCTDTDYNGAGNDGICLPREHHCSDVCRRYDTAEPAPDGSNPHEPWNSYLTYWGPDPIFPLNRRGLWLPFAFVSELTEPPSGGVCITLTCPTGSEPNLKPILPGMGLAKHKPTDLQNVGVFMHELGHQLSLYHASDMAVTNHQPNQVSSMNYSFGTTVGVVPEGTPDYAHARPTLVAASHIVPGISDPEDCDPADPPGCPQALAKDGTCNVFWFNSRCYSGGLDEQLGVGSNEDPDQPSANQARHEHVLAQMACQLSPWYVDVGPAFAAHPFNIDWNGSSTIPYDAQDSTVSPEDLAFAHLFDPGVVEGSNCAGPGLLTPVIAPSEWELVSGELPVSRQGTGIPSFCTDGFSCPDPTMECNCGWCVAPGTEPPESCLLTGDPGAPTCLGDDW